MLGNVQAHRLYTSPKKDSYFYLLFYRDAAKLRNSLFRFLSVKAKFEINNTNYPPYEYWFQGLNNRSGNLGFIFLPKGTGGIEIEHEILHAAFHLSRVLKIGQNFNTKYDNNEEYFVSNYLFLLKKAREAIKTHEYPNKNEDFLSAARYYSFGLNLIQKLDFSLKTT